MPGACAPREGTREHWPCTSVKHKPTATLRGAVWAAPSPSPEGTHYLRFVLTISVTQFTASLQIQSLAAEFIRTEMSEEH